MELLICELFRPGMTPLHRAGLGGLASTLRWMEKKVPARDQPQGRWEVSERSVKLEWRKAEPFFRRLFALAFQLQEGVIYLPGQYGTVPPPLEVRAALHEGLILSFYDHGVQSRGKAGSARTKSYEVDDKPISYRYLPLSWYKHRRDGCRDILRALEGGLQITRSLFPGAIERHAGLGATHLTQSPQLALPLLFAPVAVLALRAGGKRVNVRGKRQFKSGAAVLVPDFHSLSNVQLLLPRLLPQNARDCQVANVADAVLQAEVRLRATHLLHSDVIPSVRCVWHCPTDWSAQLQPPSAVTEVHVNTSEPQLDQFEVAMAALIPPAPRKNGDGKYFWPRSHVRPLVAENLVAGRPWYAGFVRLITAQDPLTGKPIRDQLKFERRGLNAMTEEVEWKNSGEELIVRAVHDAMYRRYGQIADENRDNPEARKKRWQNEYKRRRLAFASARTADTLRHALTDFWSRAGSNKILREGWPKVVPMLAADRWQLTRDLALLALASYQGKGAAEIDSAGAEESTKRKK